MHQGEARDKRAHDAEQGSSAKRACLRDNDNLDYLHGGSNMKAKVFGGPIKPADKPEEERYTEGVPEDKRDHVLFQILPREIYHVAGVRNWINELLMPPSEAAADAVGRGKLDRLETLMTEFQCDLVPAAAIAAEKGDQEVIDFLLAKIASSDEKNRVAWKVMEVAAGKGDLPLVQAMAGEASEVANLDGVFPDFRAAFLLSDALSCAISQGHTEVVKFLLERDYHWEIGTALDTAVAGGQHAIAEMIYKVFPRFIKGEHDYKDAGYYTDSNEEERTDPSRDEVLSHEARYGRTNSVKFLYEHGHDSSELIDRAFATAAGRGHTEALKFLHSTGRVSDPSIDIAFLNAARSGSLDIVEYLYTTSEISERSMATAFESASTAAVVKFLFATKRIPQSSLIKAFRNAALYASVKGVSFRFETASTPAVAVSNALFEAFQHTFPVEAIVLLTKKEQFVPESAVAKALRDATEFGPIEDIAVHGIAGRMEILQFLCSEGCIPASVVLDVSKTAVHQNNADVIKALCHARQSYTSKMVNLAVLSAAKLGHMNVLNALRGMKGLTDTVTRADLTEDMVLECLTIDQAPRSELCELFTEAVRLENLRVGVFLFETLTTSQATSEIASLAISIVKLFQLAAHRGDAAALKSICHADCMDAQVVSSVFQAAVKERRVQALGCLIGEDIVSSKEVVDGFTRAAKSGHGDVMRTLYSDEKISPSLSVEMFQHAASRGHLDAVKALLDKACISREVKYSALLRAAQNGRSGVLRAIGKSETWTREELDETLRVASSCKTVQRLLHEWLQHHQDT